MSDARLHPDPALCLERRAAQVTAALCDLCRGPGGKRDRQLLYGDLVTILSERDGWSYLQAEKDGYCGHVRSAALGPVQKATHYVSAPASHAYAAADFKSPDLIGLSLNSRVAVTDHSGRFCETPVGFIPEMHLTPLSAPATDPTEVAARLLGTPYLWGGNSRWGIDCSGLVQAALHACALPCPGDSDLQETQLGTLRASGGDFRRNDLLFWKGHVALVTDARTLIHATANVMAVTFEPIAEAIARIEAAGDGPVTAHRRL
ncbi:NlpC/P60 family protein [Sulfitobacter aestuarii]|uniref:NlpC/P60 family protein n=1 Tax=Sulfitobacter aestuarii TaxID=2161676 RepID=A0ABW5U230_9RHOB